jgi:hypothetical protein
VTAYERALQDLMPFEKTEAPAAKKTLMMGAKKMEAKQGKTTIERETKRVSQAYMMPERDREMLKALRHQNCVPSEPKDHLDLLGRPQRTGQRNRNLVQIGNQDMRSIRGSSEQILYSAQQKASSRQASSLQGSVRRDNESSRQLGADREGRSSRE